MAVNAAVSVKAPPPQTNVRGEHPACCVEEYYEGDEVAYLRDRLKEAKERDRIHGVIITSQAILSEWFGDDRYSRDHEYLDANFGKQAQQVVDWLLSLAPSPETRADGGDFQGRVSLWLDAAFGESDDPLRKSRRVHRFLEESLELAQSLDCTKEEALQLVDYVFGRKKGEPMQEVGGVMVTLAGVCISHDMDAQSCGETELARVWTKIDAIMAKNARQVRGSALPGTTESLGETCIDGGKCHHSCRVKCFRRSCCEPLTGYEGEWKYEN